ncbi:hypothetical protein LMG28614_01047 [Paraburkholderia ultramafica]|uniref:Short chain dehydrogenase n=1 Tax=Paraburkholderia ultramafica TaxID=1544867 RepID=A0A6S7AWW9_9BURK|nr:hypothetical protein LMG28614_01047 [Paraburkholderia ultramafica]
MIDQTRRVALVTGGANGIGWATAQRFAQQGYSVAVADQEAERARERAQQLGAAHADGPARAAGGNRAGHQLPRVGRRELHHRHGAERGWPLACVRRSRRLTAHASRMRVRHRQPHYP